MPRIRPSSFVCYVRRTIAENQQHISVFIYWGLFICLFIYSFILFHLIYDFFVSQLLVLNMLTLLRFAVAVAYCAFSTDAGKSISFGDGLSHRRYYLGGGRLGVAYRLAFPSRRSG